MNNRDIFENTVSARGQLKDSEYIKYTFKEGAKLRVLFVGNSITRHGVKEEIGWMRDCGMAASCLEKDYVHLVVKGLEKNTGRSATASRRRSFGSTPSIKTAKCSRSLRK